MTLRGFWENTLRLVSAEEASYLSPQSVHYAGKVYTELPTPYQEAFKRYRLTVIKLRNLGPLRLETFRRINKGGEPLSGQDIRLAYYGEQSPSVTFVRISGIFDTDRSGPRRFLKTAANRFGLTFPWHDDTYGDWKDWWNGKEVAKGQTPSEMFLWAIASAYFEKLGELLANDDALKSMNFSYDQSVDSALDALCAQLQFQDRNPHLHPLVATSEEISANLFPFFESWFKALMAKGPSLSVSQYRYMAAVVGAAYKLGVSPSDVPDDRWEFVVELVRKPVDIASMHGVTMPKSRGRWDGKKGYQAQLSAIRTTLKKVLKREE